MTTCIHEFCNDTATHQYAGHPICYDCWYRQMAYYVTERPWVNSNVIVVYYNWNNIINILITTQQYNIINKQIDYSRLRISTVTPLYYILLLSIIYYWHYLLINL